MHPAFLAHLIADFLLQPNWLARLKEKKKIGLAIHTAVHAAALAALVLPHSTTAWAVIAIIALLHGVIDQLKIFVQKHYAVSFETAFAADQAAHLLVLAFFVRFGQLTYPGWWLTEAGIGTFALLAAFSFGVGAKNLVRFPGQRILRIVLVAGVFGAFLIPARLLAASLCSSL